MDKVISCSNANQRNILYSFEILVVYKKNNSYLASYGKLLWKSNTGPAGGQTKPKLEDFTFPPTHGAKGHLF